MSARRRSKDPRSETQAEGAPDPASEATSEARPEHDPKRVDAIRTGLLAWYREAGRVLPWRADRDAYRILVSEMMLVQTTVAAVIPYYERFLRRFPNARSLADADESEVLKMWEGLGYYRRARQLHAAARQIVLAHGGTVPDNPEAVRALPGVGPYIAGAVLSFAFDRPEPIVEANSQRVLARLLALQDDPTSSAGRRRIWSAAARLVPPEHAGDFNQALMDLGATICTPRQPSCLLCPVVASCAARHRGLQDVIPRATPRPAPTEVREACAVVTQGDQYLVVQRGRGGLWEQFWEFPTIHREGQDPAGRSFDGPVELTEGVRRLTGITASMGPAAATLRFGVTRYRVTLEIARGKGRSGTPQPGPGLIDARWETLDGLGALTFGSAGRRILEKLRREPTWPEQ
ncbi:MAG: A/G-specific adenine glycosylase [Isosphaeraceae bacterium]